MNVSPNTFPNKFEVFTLKTLGRLNSFLVNVTVDFVETAAQRTPVQTGRARGGWLVDVGSPASGEGGLDPSASIVGPRARARLSGYKHTDGDFWICNNVPYIARLEEGYSSQNKHMLASTVNDFGSIARRWMHK